MLSNYASLSDSFTFDRCCFLDWGINYLLFFTDVGKIDIYLLPSCNFVVIITYPKELNITWLGSRFSSWFQIIMNLRHVIIFLKKKKQKHNERRFSHLTICRSLILKNDQKKFIEDKQFCKCLKSWNLLLFINHIWLKNVTFFDLEKRIYEKS